MDTAVSGRNKGIREIDLNFALVSSPSHSAETQEVLSLVTSLDLSRNEIEVLEHLEALRALRRLDVCYNLIRRVEGLPLSLTQLDISHNKLSTLDGLVQLPHLRELNVSSNRLSDFSGLVSRIPLRVLRADDNRLVSTMGLEQAPHLRLLSIANNFIEHVRDLAFLASTTELKSLNLRNNPITRMKSYRQQVAQRHATLITLDAAPLLRGASVPLSVTSFNNSSIRDETQRLSTGASKISPLPSTDNTGVSIGTKANACSSENKSTQYDVSPGEGAVGCAPSFRVPDEELVVTPERRRPSPQGKKESTVLDSPLPVAATRAPIPEGHTHRHGGQPQDTLAPTSYAKQFMASRGRPTATTTQPQATRSKDTSRGHSMLQLQRHQAALSETSATRDDDYQRSLTVSLHDSLVMQEQLRSENKQLAAKLHKAEEQLAEARRTVSAQLGDLSSTRMEREALRLSEHELKERLDRAKRSARASEGHYKDEIQTIQTQLERVKTFYESQLADLRRQLAAEIARATAAASANSSRADALASSGQHVKQSRATANVNMDIRDGPQAGIAKPDEATGPPLGPMSIMVPPFGSSPAISTGSGSPIAVVSSAALAEQLKSWLYSEIAEDVSKAETEAIERQLQVSLDADQATTSPDHARALLEAFVLSQQQRAAALPPHQAQQHNNL